jgi:hypothetical protein
LTDSTGFGLDFASDRFNFREGRINEANLSQAKTYQQFVYDNYLGLSKKNVSKTLVRK